MLFQIAMKREIKEYPTAKILIQLFLFYTAIFYYGKDFTILELLKII